MAVCLVASSGSTCGLTGDVWAHRYSTGPGGAPVALPESDIRSPSYAAWWDSACAVRMPGPATASRILTVTVSEAESVPFVAVRVNSNGVGPPTSGASKVMVCPVASSGSTCGLAGDVWAHVYVRAFGDAPVALPESVTGSPSRAATRDSAWTASPAGPGGRSAEAEAVVAVRFRLDDHDS